VVISLMSMPTRVLNASDERTQVESRGWVGRRRQTAVGLALRRVEPVLAVIEPQDDLKVNKRFTIVNHRGFGFPNAAIGDPTVGRIRTTIVDNRSRQLAFKVNF
jgi:hypothetical protein